METKVIKYVLEGPAFDDGLSIYELNVGLSEFQHLIESSYLVLSGQQRMRKADRTKLRIISREFTQGSFIGGFELQVIKAAEQGLLPLVATLSPFDIWELTKDTFNFLKLVFSSRKKGEQVKVDIGDGNTDVKVEVIKSQEVTNHFTFNGPVYICAEQSLPYYKNLTKLIENENVKNIRVESGSEKAVDLGVEDKDLFVLPVIKTELPITLKAEIYKFDKYKNTGKIRVFPLQEIPEGDYTFSLDDRREVEKFIYYMVPDAVKVKVIAEYIDDPFVENKIHNLRLLDIA